MIIDQPREASIVSYSLEESSSLGSTQFEIAEIKGQFQKRKANFLIPHRKDFYFLCLVRQGSSRHWIDFVPYTLQADTFYFSIPSQIHLKEQSEPLEGMMVSFTEEFLQLEGIRQVAQLPIIQNPDNGHELKLERHDIHFLDDLLRIMLVEFNTDLSWHNRMLQSYLSVLLIYLSRLYTEQFMPAQGTPDRALLKQFRACIEAHCHHLHQVADYAELLHLTPGHLNDRIKQQSGKTAIEHIHERLVLEAKRRLLHTDLSAKEIAYGLGFDDVSYFHRFFKRLTGETPAAYRTTIREMYP